MTLAPVAPPAGLDRLRVDLGERSYEILAGEGLVATAGAHIAAVVGDSRAVIITDEIVAPLYLGALEASLDAAAIPHSAVILPAGEGTKDLGHLGELTDRLLDSRIERSTVLIALGGGVIGDITGFAAGIVLRGLDFVQLPTTLLAQVDSSVGGKTGINTRHGKNLLGVFHQPRLVLADIGVLATLDARQLRAGYAEVAKYGLINDEPFFAWLETHGPALCEGDRAARRHAVATSCAAKAAIVAADEREAGQRALLNLGHTFGHALESETGYGDVLLHGEAVAIGMVMAFELSARLGLCPLDDAARVRRHLAAVGLPTGLDVVPGRAWSVDHLLDHMTRDKKVSGGRIRFVLAHGIGRSFIAGDVDIGDVRRFLEDSVAP